jgi:hypothetical protein
MGLRIVNYLSPRLRKPVEQAVREALAHYPGELDISITPAVDADHAEILIKEGSAWRAAYFAPVQLPVGELSERIRASLGLWTVRGKA